MNSKHSLKFTLPIFMSFYVMGFVDLVGVATGYVKQDFGLSDSLAQLLPSIVFVWFALFSIPTGIFQDRMGKRFTVNLAMIITGIGMLLPILSYSYLSTILAFMIIGIGNTILQVSANPLLLDTSSDENKAANLSLSQFIKAISSMLGPIIVAALARYTGNWRLVFPIYAAISFLSAFWLYSVKIVEVKPDKEPATLKTVFSLFKNPFIVTMILAIFFIVGFDVSINSNIANFLKSKYAISLETASLGISVYFASLMAGRFLGAILLRKVSSKTFLNASVVLTVLGLVGILLSPVLGVTWVLIFITGFGFSNIFPLIFALTIERKPEYANEISGLIIFAVCGGAVIPPIVGILTDALGVSSIIYVLLACVVYVSYATYYLTRKVLQR
ncbi:MAG: MFS transporter [Bacteroidales bacterium]|nr:MFS transporter [Bacteroidales bacterium]MBP8643383.1 MFS transporter [Bacteroidales bacterium]HNS31231.1 MFS transporter [Tenuifilaceae bacterium]HOC36875.1 MFS transporter [Tenuifilaceae bacterium]HOG72713.1 MFS transporter [Tenuifilaceae bacterium]